MNPIHLTVLASRAAGAAPRRGEPVTFGVPFPRGALSGTDTLSLRDADGRAYPLQTRVLDQWHDGSVRWLLLDSQVDAPVPETSLWLHAGGDGATPAPLTGLNVCEDGDGVHFDTGTLQVSFGSSVTFPFGPLSVHDSPGAAPATATVQIVAADGEPCTVVPLASGVEEQGPLRSVVRWNARVEKHGDQRWLELDARVTAFAASPVLRLSLTVRNPRAAHHAANFWELGDPASALLRSVRLVVTRPGVRCVEVACSPEEGAPEGSWPTPFELYQESSGGEHWNSRVHVNRHGAVPMSMRGYRIRGGDREDRGMRASPVVVSHGLAVSAPHFWQNFPRSVEVDGESVAFGLWPAQYPDSHELQGGEQKTHDVVLAFGADPVTSLPLDWCRTPAVVRADPEWYCASGVEPHLVPEAADTADGYRGLVRSAIDGADTFVAKRERIDEYGWRNFGDIFADHESALHADDPPLVSHYNNQYDAIGGFAIQFLRSGDLRWWTQMVELAAHVVDIDLYHAAGDKAAYSGGPFWHTAHYVDAGRSTHRGYPQAPGVQGGGPSNEHNYSHGLLLHHYLTGDPRSREAVEQLADWVLRIDDGSLTPFRWLCHGETGLASATRDPSHHGPGRGAGNSIATLLDGFRATRDRRYLEYAERLIRRCIHPSDDIDARQLLHAEERWSYTVFLQELARYLEECRDIGHGGRMYAWARASLLAYARWMAEHERPYLDHPEQLEYPTETWAAQDMRKCEVLLLASLHDDDEAGRSALRRRAAFFFDGAVTTLEGMPTRSSARPVVLLLRQGFRRAWFDLHPAAVATAPAGDAPVEAGPPATFVPQRRCAERRARLVGIVLVACLLLAVYLLRR